MTGPRGEMRPPERVVERGEAPQLPVSRKGRNAPRTLWADDAGNPYYSYGPGRDVPLLQPSRPQAAAVAQVIQQQQGGAVGNGATGPTGPAGEQGEMGPAGPLNELPMQAYCSAHLGDIQRALFRWNPTAECELAGVEITLQNRGAVATVLTVSIMSMDANYRLDSEVVVATITMNGTFRAVYMFDTPIALTPLEHAVLINLSQSDWDTYGMNVTLLPPAEE